MTSSAPNETIGARRPPSRAHAALLATLLASASLMATAGCGHKPPPPAAEPACKDSKIALTVRASRRVNPDDGGRPLPTVVRVYFLKSLKTLETSGFDDLWQQDRESLGADLLQTEEFTLEPGAKKVIVAARNPEATQVAVVALFRQPQGIAWRRARRLPPTCEEQPPRKGQSRPDVTPIRFLLEDYRIEAES